MKPVVFSLVFAMTLIVINIGNGCAPAFKLQDENQSNLASFSCVADEGTLSELSSADLKTGYLGSRLIHYRERGNGWILIEGDTLVRVKGPVPTTPDFSGGQRGVGVQLQSKKWPGGRVPYVIHSSLANDRRILDALAHWNSMLAGYITFYPRTNETDYLHILPVSSGCQAVLGYHAGEGAHEMEISSACGSGNVAHELGHIVGLDHEQNRPDRDQFVTIVWDKIQTSMRGMFSINSSFKGYGSYDFGSIMHYSVSAFSVDGSRTIVPKVTIPAGTVVGQRTSLSASDIASVKEMYGPQDNSGGGTDLPPGDRLSQGLLASYFRDGNFREFVTRERVTQLDHSWGSAAPADGMESSQFAVRWTGQIIPRQSGRRRLILRGTGEFRMRVLDQTVIRASFFDPSGAAIAGVQASSEIDFLKGSGYPIVIEYIKHSGDAGLRMSWRDESGSESIIPAADLSPEGLFSEQEGRLCTRN